MAHIDSKNVKLFSGPRLLGLLFLLAGLFSILSPNFTEIEDGSTRHILTGIVFSLFGAIISTSYSGTMVDVSQRRFRKYNALLNSKFGSWEALPDLEGIYLVSQTEQSTNLPNGISPTLSGSITDFYVLAISANNQPVFALTYSDKDKARKTGKELASGLEVAFKE